MIDLNRETARSEREAVAQETSEFYTNGKGAELLDALDSTESDPIFVAVGTCTYSCDDNKIRIYPKHRLDGTAYQRLKDCGFKWAPKQKLFVAPMWTPQREDIALALCGEISDDDTSLVDRAEERAERFEDYSDRREADAHAAKAQVDRIADGIPLGQPILVGHHSERRARKDAQRIENGMRKAVSMWETSKYWQRRAKGAIAHAKYKELPGVRARRIKTIEADKRKRERELTAAEALLKRWNAEPLTRQEALDIANYSYQSFHFPRTKYPRKPGASQYDGAISLWSALNDEIVTAEQARDLAVPALEASIASAKRWLIHFAMRLVYENCMLEESGYVEPEKVKSDKQTLPLCNYKAETITYPNMYYPDKMITVGQVEMTKAQYAKIYKDNKWTKIVDRSHKVRIAQVKGDTVAVFLTDSKVHDKPAPAAPVEPKLPPLRMPRERAPVPERTAFDDMKDSLKAGVRVVSAPQLFPTPLDIAWKMIELADIDDGDRVLEPSAGTGVLAKAVRDSSGAALTLVELNAQLCEQLTERFDRVVRGDFLEQTAVVLGGQFDVVIMNPPFANGADILHIQHAISLTKSGGRVVAICANGPRQIEQLKPEASTWVELPEGSFAAEGTNVRTALIVFDVE